MKPNSNSDEVHPQLSNKGCIVDGALMGSWFTVRVNKHGWLCC